MPCQNPLRYICAGIKRSPRLPKNLLFKNSRRYSPNINFASNLRAHVIAVLLSDMTRDVHIDLDRI